MVPPQTHGLRYAEGRGLPRWFQWAEHETRISLLFSQFRWERHLWPLALTLLGRNKPVGGTRVSLPKDPFSCCIGKALGKLVGGEKTQVGFCSRTHSAQCSSVPLFSPCVLGSLLCQTLAWGNQAAKKAWCLPQKPPTLATKCKKKLWPFQKRNPPPRPPPRQSRREHP